MGDACGRSYDVELPRFRVGFSSLGRATEVHRFNQPEVQEILKNEQFVDKVLNRADENERVEMLTGHLYRAQRCAEKIEKVLQPFLNSGAVSDPRIMPC